MVISTPARGDPIIAAHETEADDRHDQRLRTVWHGVDGEAAIRVRDRALSRRLDLHEHGGQRRTRARFDDLSANLSSRLRRRPERGTKSREQQKET